MRCFKSRACAALSLSCRPSPCWPRAARISGCDASSGCSPPSQCSARDWPGAISPHLPISSSDFVRASELTTHLKEMNLAAAGLAHETRNPLNIIRGLAQMISKQTDAPTEIREKSRAIVDEADKVTVQLNEFINYSRPARSAALHPGALVGGK